MTEQMIERCLERLSICKTTDVMNFDYAGTLAYIKRLQEENAELRERLEKAVELPCKVGDTVYQYDHAGNIYASRIRSIIFNTRGIAFDERAIGKSIFLTKEAAEARLTELKGEEE